MKRWTPHPFTLRQLQYLLAVAEHRSFRRAAAACAVAQPSLSNQIAQVELALGVTFFERLPRGAGITLLPKISLKAENRARALVTRPFGPRGPCHTLALAWRKTIPSDSTLRALAQAMRGVVGRG